MKVKRWHPLWPVEVILFWIGLTCYVGMFVTGFLEAPDIVPAGCIVAAIVCIAGSVVAGRKRSKEYRL